MTEITLKGNPIHTAGELPEVGTTVADYEFTNTGLEDVYLSDFSGTKILNIFPSLDTGICAASVRAFNEKAGGLDGVTVLNISEDLPFAHSRFCASEGIEDVVDLSTFRTDFPEDFGVVITDGPMSGLCSRAVVVLDDDNKVLYREQVPEIAQEPDYEAALDAVS